MNTTPLRLALITSAFVLAACGNNAPAEADRPAAANPTADAAAAAAAVDAATQRVPADEFLAAIARHCGEAFAGRIITNEPAPAPGAEPDPFEALRIQLRLHALADEINRLHHDESIFARAARLEDITARPSAGRKAATADRR